MKFDIDNQTIDDLDIMPIEKGSKSAFLLFNKLVTNKGKSVLLDLISHPISSLDHLNERKKTILYIQKEQIYFDFDNYQFDFIEYYLLLNKLPLRNNYIDSIADKIKNRVDPDNDQYVIYNGIFQFIELYKKTKNLINILNKDCLPIFLNELKTRAVDFNNLIKDYTGLTKRGKIKFRNINRLDYLFRKKGKNKVREYLDSLYKLECFFSIIKSIDEYGLSFADYNSADKPKIILKSVFHPFIKDPIVNDFELSTINNLCFLTGPNMAGKSTLLKSIGLSLYLSHIGFPVPAKYMETTIFNGLITTINLLDNINKGYSHYYSEVRRVKETANRLLEKGNYLVIFDELFRGTNVKDAFEASYEIIKSLSKVKDSVFLISTHINEIAEKFDDNLNISYKYLDSKLVEDKAIYDYKLKNGVTSERLGMQIIKNENIFEILDQVIERQT